MKTLAIIVLIVLFHSPCYSDPRISIGNGLADADALLAEATFYAAALNLATNVYIRINPTLRLSDDHDATLEYRLMNDTIHQVVIYISKKISRSDQLLALAHEMVHVKQYVTGQLKPVNVRSFLWMKKEINVNQVPYPQRPWEIEAHELAYDLRRLYLIRKVL